MAIAFADDKDTELLKAALGELLGALANAREKMEVEEAPGRKKRRRGDK